MPKLLCTCDPEPEASLRGRKPGRSGSGGVRVHPITGRCLRPIIPAGPVVAPTPIHLHREIARGDYAFGLPPTFEKPPPSTISTGANDRAAKAQQGIPGRFNFSSKERQAPRKDSLRGFGAVREAPLIALCQPPVFREYILGGSAARRRRVVPDRASETDGPFCPHMLSGPARRICSPGLKSPPYGPSFTGPTASRADTFFVETDLTSGVTLRFGLATPARGSTHSETILCTKAVSGIRSQPNRDMLVRTAA